MKILVAATERFAQRSLTDILGEHGLATVTVTTENAAVTEVFRDFYDLLIVAHGGPFDAVHLCQTLRNRRAFTLILVLMPPSIPDVVAALDAGADGCLASPFTTDELLAQVRALLRRYR